MADEQERAPVGQPPGQDGGALRPSVADAKETASQVASVLQRDPRGVKAGSKRGPYQKTKVAEEIAPAAAFSWGKKDVALILDAPFAFAYAAGGPDHEHWHKAGEKLEQSQCYDKLAYVVNRLGVKDPLYLILGVGLAEYLGAIGSCALASLKIRRKKIEKEEKSGT